MTHHPENGILATGTGDINLAAAIMALGIPMDPHRPCHIIHKDDGKSYGRFMLLSQSIDGKHQIGDLMEGWNNPAGLAGNHPFAWLMAFIRERPQGVSTPDDWIGYAHDYLAERSKAKPGMPTRLAHIPDFVTAFADDLAGYVFAFIDCRNLAFLEFKAAKHQVMQTRGRAHAIIDANLSRPIRNEILARLEGA
jgi:hypothetical protein